MSRLNVSRRNAVGTWPRLALVALVIPAIAFASTTAHAQSSEGAPSSAEDSPSAETPDANAEGSAGEADRALEPEDEAREEYDRGEAFFQAGNFEEALLHFQAAYDLVRYPALLFNIASTYDRLRRPREAIATYEAYLDSAHGERVGYVRSRIRLLEEQREQATDETDADSSAGAAESEGGRDDDGLPEEPFDEGPSIAPWVVLIGGGVVAAGSLIPGLSALSIKGDLDARCAGGNCLDADRADADRMDTLALVSDIMLITGVSAAAAGLLWLLLDTDDPDSGYPDPDDTDSGDAEDDEVTASFGCGLDGCAGQVSVAF